MAASRSRSRSPVRCTKSSNARSRLSACHETCDRQSCASTGQLTSYRGRKSKVSKSGSRQLQRRQRQHVSPEAGSSQPARGQRKIGMSTPGTNNNSTNKHGNAAAKSGGNAGLSRNNHQDINSASRPNTRSSCRSQTAVTSRPNTRSSCRSEPSITTRPNTGSSYQSQRVSPYGKKSGLSTRPRRQVDTLEPRPSISEGTRRRVASPKSTAPSRCQSQLADSKGSGRKPKRRRQGKRRRIAPLEFRTRSPVRQMTRAEKERNSQELIYRIRSLPMNDRPIPNTTDPTVLGFELKVRLGARAPSLVETGRRGGRVTVTEANEKSRLIPVLDISPEQDPKVHCSVRIKKVAENRRRGRGVR